MSDLTEGALIVLAIVGSGALLAALGIWWAKRGDRRSQQDDLIPVLLSPGRHTTKRPGETWAEATNRLTEGRDL